jgi:hypothetical protein
MAELRRGHQGLSSFGKELTSRVVARVFSYHQLTLYFFGKRLAPQVYGDSARPIAFLTLRIQRSFRA